MQCPITSFDCLSCDEKCRLEKGREQSTDTVSPRPDMPEDRESLGWKLFMQEMEIRVSALEADAEKIKRDVETIEIDFSI